MVILTEEDYKEALYNIRVYEQNQQYPFPKFVFLNIDDDKKTALRLVRLHGEYVYYRDGGGWFVDFTKTLLSIFEDEDNEELMLHNKPLTKCTYEEWKMSNGQFALNVTPENSLDITQGYLDPELVIIDY